MFHVCVDVHMFRRPEGYPGGSDIFFSADPPEVVAVSFECSIEPAHRRRGFATVLMAVAKSDCPPVVGTRELRMLSEAIHAALVPHVGSELRRVGTDIIDTEEHAGIYA